MVSECHTYLVYQGGDDGQRRAWQCFVMGVRVTDQYWGGEKKTTDLNINRDNREYS